MEHSQVPVFFFFILFFVRSALLHSSFALVWRDIRAHIIL